MIPMKTFLIDGNNVIGKDSRLKKVQQKDKQASREKLVNLVDNYFHDKNQKVFIHFDGFKSSPINSTKAGIIYSDSKTADDTIKRHIEQLANKKNTVVITSDSNLTQFAKVCHCGHISSEEFLKLISRTTTDDEQKKIDEMNDINLFKKIFEAE